MGYTKERYIKKRDHVKEKGTREYKDKIPWTKGEWLFLMTSILDTISLSIKMGRVESSIRMAQDQVMHLLSEHYNKLGLIVMTTGLKPSSMAREIFNELMKENKISGWYFDTMLMKEIRKEKEEKKPTRRRVVW